MSLPKSHQQQLDRLRVINQFRELRSGEGQDFSSNDYLGFSQSADLRESLQRALESESRIGATASRLLRGHLSFFDDVEEELAEFSGGQSALVFPSGFQLNLAVLSTLPLSGDLVFSDEFNHASLIDGLRLSRAQRVIYSHLDLQDLKEKLEQTKCAGNRWIVTESVFSMSGNLAPLLELSKLAKRYNARLLVDEAHATGLDFQGVGGDATQKKGGGLAQSLGLRDEVFLTLHTGGKALGVSGAWVSCERSTKEFLVNFARPLIFSTAPSPFLFHGLQQSVRYWNESGLFFASMLRSKIELFLRVLPDEFCLELKKTASRASPIVPILLKSNSLSCNIASQIRSRGYDVRAIRPPTVPEGTARLRIVLHSFNQMEDVEQLASELATALREQLR